VSQKSVAGSAAFQAAGVGKALIRGHLFPLQVAHIHGCRQDAGAPRELGEREPKGERSEASTTPSAGEGLSRHPPSGEGPDHREPIDLEHYKQVQTVHGALNAHAGEALNELDSEDRDLARRLFQNLT